MTTIIIKKIILHMVFKYEVKMKKSAKSKFHPKFYNNFEFLFISIISKFMQLFKLGKNKNSASNMVKLNNIFEIIELRKKLLLYKFIKFNNQFYSTPTIPAFPSHPYDKMVEKGGLNFYQAGTTSKLQIDSVFLAVTNKCNLHCKYCYEKFNINKQKSIPVSKWTEIISKLQNKGVNIFILTGGEPLLEFDKLIEILNLSDTHQSDFHIHTSGASITKEKVKALKKAGLKAAAVGLDNYDAQKHDKMRGKGSFEEAVKALKLFNNEGILTYINFCAHKEIINDGGLFKYLDFVKNLNVSMIQLLEPRPCGGYFNNDFENWLNIEDKMQLKQFTILANKSRKYRNHPLIYYVAHVESKTQLGCHMGGLSHFYINSGGDVCPCVFFPVTYGNILSEDIYTIFKRMRENIPFPILSDCPSMILTKEIVQIYKNENEIPIKYTRIQNSLNNLFNNEL